VVTSGPLAPATKGPRDGRDLPVVGQRPTGRHGVEAGAGKESEQA